MQSALFMDQPTIRFSAHARQRMASLRVSENEVRWVVAHPLRTQPGGPGHGPGRRVHVGTRIEAVVSTGEHLVITIKLHTDDPYVHGEHHLDNLPTATALFAA